MSPSFAGLVVCLVRAVRNVSVENVRQSHQMRVEFGRQTPLFLLERRHA